MNDSIVVWQPVPALPIFYAIESDDARALEAARQLFAPWIVENSAASIAQTWRMSRDESRDESGYDVSHAGRSATSQRTLTDALAHVEYAAIGHTVAHLPSAFIGFHGALLSRDVGGKTRGVLVVGPKEAGKSTLACALWRAGWRLHCDDFTLLDSSSYAHATARRVSLRVGSRALLGDLWEQAQQTPSARALGAGLAFHPHELVGRAARAKRAN